MTEEKSSIFSTDVKTLLNLVQIVALVVTLVWVFAIMSVQQNQNTSDIQRNHNNITIQQARTAEIEIKQAVTTEQYRQIMQKLDELNSKMN